MKQGKKNDLLNYDRLGDELRFGIYQLVFDIQRKLTTVTIFC